MKNTPDTACIKKCNGGYLLEITVIIPASPLYDQIGLEFTFKCLDLSNLRHNVLARWKTSICIRVVERRS